MGLKAEIGCLYAGKQVGRLGTGTGREGGGGPQGKAVSRCISGHAHFGEDSDRLSCMNTNLPGA